MPTTAPVPAASTNLTPAMRNSAQTAQWKELLRQQVFDLRVALPGIILAFDPTEQVATVQPAVRERVVVPGQAPQNVDLPYLYDIPVVLPRGGSCALTVPIAAGDECLLVFADMPYDYWWQAGGLQNQYQFESPRHDLADAFCIPGPWSQPKVMPNYSTSSLQARTLDGASVVDVAAAGVAITGATVTAANGGTTQALMTKAFLDYWNANILPFLQSKGYAGPDVPAGSYTTVLEAE